ncbi:hypothetical protein MMPV_005632 [Pyropia vietnamensis]
MCAYAAVRVPRVRGPSVGHRPVVEAAKAASFFAADALGRESPSRPAYEAMQATALDAALTMGSLQGVAHGTDGSLQGVAHGTDGSLQGVAHGTDGPLLFAAPAGGVNGDDSNGGGGCS